MNMPLEILTDAGEERARAAVLPGHSLPAYYYESAGRYARDMAIMRETSWFLAGHASRIPDAGDYFLIDIDNESIIVIRARGGAIRAFYNVCRHRGSRVCLERSGHARLMVCPYHAWTYDADGQLVGAPDMPAWFDKAEYGLKPCHVDTAGGLIFISLARGAAPGFEDFTTRMKPFMALYKPENTKIVALDHLSCPANWKLVVENFAECYHCTPSHKEYGRVHDLAAMMSYTPETEGGWMQRLKASGVWREGVLDGPSSPHLQAGMQMHIGRGALSGGRTGKPMAPRLGDLPEWTGIWTAVVFNPMSQVAFYDDHIILFTFIPRGPTETDCLLAWLVRDDAVEGQDYDPDEVAYMWRHTIAEDKTICANNQLGVASAAYQPGPYSSTETRAVETVEWYLRHFVDVDAR